MTTEIDESQIDEGILGVVRVLRRAGINTFDSCQGGGYTNGHASELPRVWFYGDESEGERAEHVALNAGFIVFHVARFWYTRRGERFGPYWELQFVSGAAHVAPGDSLI